MGCLQNMIRIYRFPIPRTLQLTCNRYHTTHGNRSLQLDDCRVLISTCSDVFYNLALEDWIYNKVDFKNKNWLLIWTNNPCIVIGRHQNPWAECDVSRTLENQVEIARRRSGGGTVYHDQGNVNFTFFTCRKQYNRAENLDVIVSALRTHWDLDVAASDRDDILLENEFKISGTAAKLGGKVAYHHCTLLLDIDIANIQTLLHKGKKGIQTKATESVKSVVKNLKDVEPRLNSELISTAVAEHYLRQRRTPFNKDTCEYADPTSESRYPGITSLHRELKSWKWIYGHTPAFSVEETCSTLINNRHYELHLSIQVNKGIVEEANIILSPSADMDMFIKEICNSLQGEYYWWKQLLPLLVTLLHHDSSHNELRAWIIDRIIDVIR